MSPRGAGPAHPRPGREPVDPSGARAPTGRPGRAALSAVWLVCAAVACGHGAAPSALEGAREALRRAQAGPAAAEAPEELHRAERSLREAEHLWVEADGRADAAAYVALRRAERAEAVASQRLAERSALVARRALAAGVGAQHPDRVPVAGRELVDGASAVALDQTRADLARERALRERLEGELAAALAKLAPARRDPRGLVLTFGAEVLFESDSAALRPRSLSRLDALAALLGRSGRHVLVEGFTDAVGPASYNRELSQLRAETVRSHLVARGVARERIDAVGHGEEQPIAEQETAEGRARNRRVEIVLSEEAPPVDAP